MTRRLRPERDQLVSEVTGTLRERILSGHYPMGTRLRQEALAAELGVSRTPIREALQVLGSAGLVELTPRRGALVRTPTPRQIRDSYLVRAELEGLAAALAAEHATDRHLADLSQAARDFHDALQPSQADALPDERGPHHDAWSDANDRFHTTILDAADNQQLTSLVHNLHASVPRNLTWHALDQNKRLLHENATQHDRILQAIRDHDPSAARATMTGHIAQAGELIARTLERATPEHTVRVP